MNKEILDVVAEVFKGKFKTLREAIDELKARQPEKGDKGEAGQDSSSLDVAIALAEKDEFLDAVKGDKGEPGKDAEPAKPIDVGRVVESVAATLNHDEKFIKATKGDKGESIKGEPGEDGKDADPVDTDAICKQIVADHADELRGDKGDSIKGEIGTPGIGYDTPCWEKGIYRKDSTVTAFVGQTFMAARDTNKAPGSDDWTRIGTHGFRWRSVKPKNLKTLREGDLYIDNGTTFVYTNGRAYMFAQRGIKGADGRDGSQGASVIEIRTTHDAMLFVFDDGAIVEADVAGFTEFIKTLSEAAAVEKTISVFEEQHIEEQKYGTPIRTFRGIWTADEKYGTGDVITQGKSSYLAVKDPAKGTFRPDDWVKFGSSGGGGGGGGGSWSSTAASNLNMANHLVMNIKAPRSGTIGRHDAVSRTYMETAIASSALYQGLTLPLTGCPKIITATDSGFVAPIADEEVGKPVSPVVHGHAAPAGGPPPGAHTAKPAALPSPVKGRCAVWFEMKGSIYDAFTIDPDSEIVLAAPAEIKILINDMKWRTVAIPAGTYKLAAINALLASIDGADFGGIVGHVKIHLVATTAPAALTPWLMVETVPTLGYAIIAQPMSGGGFPPAVEDGGTPATVPPTIPKPDHSAVGHTWNWIVETKDPEIPEYAPPGIPGLAPGTILDNGDRLQWNAHQRPDPAFPHDPKKSIGGMDLIRGASLTKHAADKLYWEVDGTSMYWHRKEYGAGSIVYSGEFLWVSLQTISVGDPAPNTTGSVPFWRRVNNGNNLIRALVAPTVPPPRIGDMWMNISPVGGVAQEILQIWNGTRWAHPNNMPSITRGETLPATPSNGDLHYMQGGAEETPRIMHRSGGAWVNFGTSIQIHETADQVAGGDRNTIGLQTGTTAEPHPVIWMQNESGVASEQGWQQVDRLWNSAWGSIGNFAAQGGWSGYIYGDRDLMSNNYTFVHGRRYKVSYGVSIHSGGDSTQDLTTNVLANGSGVAGTLAFQHPDTSYNHTSVGVYRHTGAAGPGAVTVHFGSASHHCRFARVWTHVEDVGPA